MTSHPSRRTVLKGGLTAAAATAIGMPALTACSTGGATGGTSNADVELPDYIPFEGASPDIEGGELLPQGFYSYPTEVVPSVSKPPLDGQMITAMTNIFNPVPPGRGDNTAWQAVEKELGGKVEITIVPASDYETKTSTKIAGDKLPDLFFYDGTGISDLPGFAEAKCADLGKFIAGEKVADYPNLANIPTAAWKAGVKGGKLYGLPIPREGTGGCGFVNMRFFEPIGITDTSQIADTDEFLSVLTELTRPDKGRYAVASNTGGVYALSLWKYIFGVPYAWRSDGKKLVKDFETDEYKDAVAFAKRVYDAGCFAPGSEGFDTQKKKNSFMSGEAAMIYDGLPAIYAFGPEMAAQSEENRPTPFIPFGDGVAYLDNTAMAITFITEQDDDAKVESLLRVADYLAAPFGTSEHLLINYGVDGQDHDRDDNGNPVLTESGSANVNVPWKYLAAGPSVIYDAKSKTTVDDYHGALQKLLPIAVENPVENYRSTTDDKKGLKLSQKVTDLVTSIIAGRSEMSELDGAIKTWRNQGGDKIRGEFEDALAQ